MIEREKDTLIQGKTCRKLTTTRFDTDGTSERERDEFLYADDINALVYRLADNDSFYILYDMGAQPGDSWTTRYYDAVQQEEITSTILVDSISTVEIQDYFLKVLYVTTTTGDLSFGSTQSPPIGKAKIIQMIGGTWYLFPQNYAQLESDIRIGLRCYESCALGEYNFGLYNDCRALIKSNSIHENDQNKLAISIFPNPARHYLHISTKDMPLPFDFQLFDALGRQVLQEQVWVAEQKINIEALPPGTYWYRVVQKDEMLTRGKVVVY